MGVNSHWNPYSPLGNMAILKEKLRPLQEMQVLLQKIKNNEITESSRKRKISSFAALPDSTT
jgi:hypothetical protein